MKSTIDIGTNSVLLLIGEPLPDGSVKVTEDRAEGTRLGEGLAARGEISPEAAMRTMAVLDDYMKLCDVQRVTGIACVGTAALRDASNAGDFIMLVKRTFGLDIEVVSPEREAELTFAACEHDFGSEIVVLDIGGGSTELIARDPEEGLKLLSLPTGCVTLLEEFVRGDPADEEDLTRARSSVREVLESLVDLKTYARPNDRKFVATAGTATTLKAMDLALEPYRAELVHGEALSISRVREIMDELMSKTLEQRRQIKGLPAQRADVILTGAALLHEAMSYLGYATALISDRGVKWGLFYEKFC
jgi:exopolyphosphatase/guanosine-5'-triphosphate,3'-diphosphate pyrophosphatase